MPGWERMPRRFEVDAAHAPARQSPRADVGRLTPNGLLQLQRTAGNRAAVAVVARVRTDKKTSRILIEKKDIDRVLERVPSKEQGKPLIKRIKAIIKTTKASDALSPDQLAQLAQVCVEALARPNAWVAELADLLLLGLPLSDPAAQQIQQRLKFEPTPGTQSLTEELEETHGRERVRLTTFTSSNGISRPLIAIINAIVSSATPEDAIAYLEKNFADDLPRLLAISSVNATLTRFFLDYRVPKTIPQDVLAELRTIVDEYGRTADEDTAQVARLRFEELLASLMARRRTVYDALMLLTTAGRAPISFAGIVNDVREGKKCNQELAGFMRNALGNALMEKPDPKRWLAWLEKVTRGQMTIVLETDYWTPIARPPRRGPRKPLPALAVLKQTGHQ